MRIASICPSNTELAGYLNLTSQLIAVDDYSDWPTEVQSLPRLGPDLDIDIEKLEALKPDLVLASLSVPGMEKNIEKLKERNLPYVVFNPNSLSDIGEDLLQLGRLTGTEAQAKKVVQSYLQTIDHYRNLSRRVQQEKKIYWEWWPKPVFTPGGTNWLTEISELAGGRNLFYDEPIASVQTDWDDVVNRHPDVICLAWVGVRRTKLKPELVTTRDNWKTLYELKKPPIHILEEALFCRPSPRLLLGLKELAPLIHPSVYPANDGIDPLQFQDRF